MHFRIVSILKLYSDCLVQQPDIILIKSIFIVLYYCVLYIVELKLHFYAYCVLTAMAMYWGKYIMYWIFITVLTGKMHYIFIAHTIFGQVFPKF